MTNIIGTFPTTLVNGTIADATVVMQLFSWIQSQTNGNGCPATTGTTVLKGDGAGGTTPAVAGTDYTQGTFVAAGASATSRSFQSKCQDFVSVIDYGADPTGVADSYAAFVAAIAALPTGGGRLIIPETHAGSTYKLTATPTLGTTNSIYWDIGGNVKFTGAGAASGQFPYMATNVGQMAVGPWIQSQSMLKSLNSNGGIAAFNVEMAQPSGYGAGQSVGVYVGSYSNNATVGGNLWSMNTLMTVGSSVPSGSYCQNIEMDINNQSAGATVKGLAISGVSTSAPTMAIEILMGTTKWKRGIDIHNCTVGIQIYTDTTTQGMVIGNPGQVTNTCISMQQITTGGDAIFVQRLNAGQTGYFMRCVDDTNSTTLIQLGADGRVGAASFIVGAGAITVAAGQICIGNSTSNTASSGGQTLPGNPAGFLAWFDGSTTIKIPYYNN